MLAAVRTISPNTTIQRARVLPVTGRVLARIGQVVEPPDAIAEARLERQYQWIDLARGLGVAAHKVEQYLQVDLESLVYRGDILAGPAGIGRRVVQSPENGTIISLENGRALMEIETEPLILRSGFAGKVVDLIENRGAVIETSGALVQGVWGNGKLSSGQIFVLARSPHHVLTPDQLNNNAEEKIVVGGHCENREVLKKAVDLRVRGILLASLNSRLVRQAAALSLPVLIVEGFGKHSLVPAAFRLLVEHDRQAATLNAGPADPYRPSRPELVISCLAGEKPEPACDFEFVSVGSQVRVITSLYLGRTGTLTRFLGNVILPNGIRSEAGEIVLENGETLVVPLRNLEILRQA